jgi:hypothetical protein
MEARTYRRRATGELAIDPALFQLVKESATLVDRLICACGSPIAEDAAAASPRDPAHVQEKWPWT